MWFTRNHWRDQCHPIWEKNGRLGGKVWLDTSAKLRPLLITQHLARTISIRMQGSKLVSSSHAPGKQQWVILGKMSSWRLNLISLFGSSLYLPWLEQAKKSSTPWWSNNLGDCRWMFGSRYMLTGPTYMPSVHIVLCACNVELKFWQGERWSYLYAHAHIAGTLR